MENASKALLIAGTIIISVFIMGIFVYLFRAGGSLGETYDSKQIAEQLELYNSKFEAYSSKENTIMDLISLINLAYSTNEAIDYDAQSNISITINSDAQKFIIKNTKGTTDDDILGKNQVYVDTAINRKKIISVYDLASETLEYLGVSSDDDNKDDKLSETKLVDSGSSKITYYKYIFTCTKIEYGHSNGKVSNMEFDMQINSDW